MVSIYEVQANDLIKAVAEDLKTKIKMPEWAKFVKTGAHKERPPVQQDWWWVRAAAILRTIYKDGPIGISKLRSKYGGPRNRGVKPEKFTKGSGAIIRTIVKQLEEIGLVKKKFVKDADTKDKKGKVKIYTGREISPEGQSLLDKHAKKVYKKPTEEIRMEATKPKPVEVKPKVEVVKEEPKLAEEKKDAKVEVVKEEKKEAKPEKKEKKPKKAKTEDVKSE